MRGLIYDRSNSTDMDPKYIQTIRRDAYSTGLLMKIIKTKKRGRNQKAKAEFLDRR